MNAQVKVQQQAQEVDNAETAALVAVDEREEAIRKLSVAQRHLEDAKGKQQHSLQVTTNPEVSLLRTYVWADVVMEHALKSIHGINLYLPANLVRAHLSSSSHSCCTDATCKYGLRSKQPEAILHFSSSLQGRYVACFLQCS